MEPVPAANARRLDDRTAVAQDRPPLQTVRRGLFGALIAGLIGTGSELLLLGHTEGLTQLVPIGLIAVAILLCAWHAILPSAASVTVLRVVMGACVLSGAVGVGLHYRGNLEFELEMYPTLAGRELIQKVATGATPVLAPGTLSLLGVIGLLYTYRHPAGTRGMPLQEERP